MSNCCCDHAKESVSTGLGEVGLRAPDLGGEAEESGLVQCTKEKAKGDLRAPCSHLKSRYKDDGARLFFNAIQRGRGHKLCLVRLGLEIGKSFSTQKDGTSVSSPLSELFTA